jgi:FlaA1/EpsC-like NDP-sugar epimerase
VGKKFSEKHLSLLRRTKVVLFGTGSLAASISHFLQAQQIFPFVVFDNDSCKEGTLFEGVKVVSPSFIKGVKIVIASMWEQEISLQLEALGYEREDILHMEFEG